MGLKFSDDELRKYVEVWEACNFNQLATSAKLGVSRHSVHRALKRAQDAGIIEDMNETMFLKRRSTLSGPDGETKLQWKIEEADKVKLDALAQIAVQTLIDQIPPLAPIPSLSPDIYMDDMLTNYLIGDAHGGAYVWGREAEEDYDLEIWQEDLMAAVDRLVASSPPTREAVMLNLGDWFHADDRKSVTPQSGNQLDTDGRWAKVVETGLKVQRHAIERMLQKHHTVRVVEIPGNHDPHAALILIAAMGMLFDANPRVIIEDTQRYIWTYEYGKNLISACHGDKAPLAKLPCILSADYPQAWGRTEFRTIWHGHFHSKRVEEHPGCTVEGFRSLVAKDKWHWDQGYRSLRDMQSVVLHKEFGEIERHTAGVKLARAGRAARAQEGTGVG